MMYDIAFDESKKLVNSWVEIINQTRKEQFMEDLSKFVALAELGEKLLGLVKESGLLKRKPGRRGFAKRRALKAKGNGLDAQPAVQMPLPLVSKPKKKSKKRRKKPTPIPLPVDAAS